MRKTLISIALTTLVACGATEAQSTEVEMVLHVPCVTPPCGARGAGGEVVEAPPPVMTGRPAPTMLALGWDHSCALAVDGSVWCWGANSRDQLGDIGGDRSSIPSRVPSIPPMAALWAGANQTCGRARDDGQLWCWGETGLGPAREPVFATSLPFTNVRTVALAYRKGCFITDEGAVYCWGEYGGVHGPRWDAPRRVPVDGVLGLQGGMNRFCALTGRGVTCWGMHPAYTVVERIDPVFWRLPDLRNVSLFAFDDFAPHPNVWIVDQRGRVLEATPTGRRSSDHSKRHLELREMPHVEGAVELAACGGSYCARTSGGTAACWGSNSSGAVGDGTTATRQEARTLPLTEVEEVAVGKQHACARAQGKLFCWGANGSGQAGAGDAHEVLAPTEVPW